MPPGLPPMPERRERAVERQDVEAVRGQVELADDLGPQQRHDVREDREPEAREDLLGHRRAAEHVAPLEDDGLQPRAREIGGADQAVVAAADHDRVVALAKAREPPGSPHADASVRAPASLASRRDRRAPSSRHTLMRTGSDRAVRHVSIGTAVPPADRAAQPQAAVARVVGLLRLERYADAHDIEYNAIREAAALIDVSPLYKYRVAGPTRCALVDRVDHPRRDEDRRRPGHLHAVVRRARQGHRRRHGPPARRGPLPLDRGRSAAPLAAPERAGLDVAIEDVTEAIAAVALQGPLARAVLEAATGRVVRRPALLPPPRRRGSARVTPSTCSRTGYTGDLGYELWIPAERAAEVWER